MNTLTTHINDTQIHGDRLHISWADGQQSEYHALWLRDHCPSRWHAKTRERTHDTAELDLNVSVINSDITANQLLLTYSDGHHSKYDQSYLYQYRNLALDIRPFGDYVTLDPAADPMPECDYEEVMDTAEGLLKFLNQIKTYGFSIVRNTPCNDWQVDEVAKRIAYLRETNFGRRFEVISKPNPNNQAYTHDALANHTDLSNWEAPPGIQFLHCLNNESEGGESVLVDGFRVADQLREQDPESWQLLTEVRINNRFHDEKWDIRYPAPLICMVNGVYHEIRYNPGLMGAQMVSPEDTVKFYKALQGYAQLSGSNGSSEWLFKLQPGDLMVFNNRRTLHGRKSFDPNTGARKLQGLYVDWDEWMSCIRVLQGQNMID